MKYLAVCALCAMMFLSGCGPSTGEIRTRGISQFEIGHLDKAQKDFDLVLNQSPADPESLYYMGRIAQAEGRYEQAMFYYQSCLDARPNHLPARTYLDQAQADAGLTGEMLHKELP